MITKRAKVVGAPSGIFSVGGRTTSAISELAKANPNEKWLHPPLINLKVALLKLKQAHYFQQNQSQLTL